MNIERKKRETLNSSLRQQLELIIVQVGIMVFTRELKNQDIKSTLDIQKFWDMYMIEFDTPFIPRQHTESIKEYASKTNIIDKKDITLITIRGYLDYTRVHVEFNLQDIECLLMVDLTRAPHRKNEGYIPLHTYKLRNIVINTAIYYPYPELWGGDIYYANH